MTLRLNGEFYRKFCIVAAVGVFMTNFANFTEKWGFIPLYWIVALIAISAPLLASGAVSQEIPIRPLIVWCAGFLVLSMIWYFPSVQNARNYQEIQTRILSVIFILLILFLVSRPQDQPLARIMVALATLVSVGLNIYEVFNPMTFSKIPGRSSGLFENSNQSGCAIMLGMIVSYGVIPPRLRVPFVTLAGIGIVATFTRAAMLGWVLVSLFWMAQSGLNVRKVRTMILVAAVGFGFVASPFWSDMQQSLEKNGVLDMDNLQRLAFFSSGTSNDDSAEWRKQVVREGFALWEKKPLTGYGTGAFRTMPGYSDTVHNTYVAMLLDHGVTGLFVLPSLVLAAIYRANLKTIELTGPFVLCVLMWGFFSHNTLEERYILLPVAVTAAIVTANRVTRVEQHTDVQATPRTEPMGAIAQA